MAPGPFPVAVMLPWVAVTLPEVAAKLAEPVLPTGAGGGTTLTVSVVDPLEPPNTLVFGTYTAVIESTPAGATVEAQLAVPATERAVGPQTATSPSVQKTSPVGTPIPPTFVVTVAP